MAGITNPDKPNRTVLRSGDKIIVTEVFDVTPELVQSLRDQPCIGDCNAACDIPGAPSGAQVTAFYKKH